MANVRLIARLDIKGPNLIKGIHLEGLRVVGNPQEFARRYYQEGVDELIYMDTVASLYGRNNLTDIVRHAAHHVFVPMTIGGGMRSVEDVRQLLRSGADKVAINTAALARPQLIREVAETFGSQCMVISIEAKQIAEGQWEAYGDNGRERSGRDVHEWVQEAESLGAGEVLLTSVDKEGTGKGFDYPLTKMVTQSVNIPVIASGGMGKPEDAVSVVNDAGADAVAIAKVLHYKTTSLNEVRSTMQAAGLGVRTVQ